MAAAGGSAEEPDPELAEAVGFKGGGGAAGQEHAAAAAAAAADPFALAKQQGAVAQERLRDPKYQEQVRRERERRRKQHNSNGEAPAGAFDFACGEFGGDEAARRRAAREHSALRTAAKAGRKAEAAEAVERRKMADLLLKCGAGGVAEKLGLLQHSSAAAAAAAAAGGGGAPPAAAALPSSAARGSETSAERGTRLRALSGLPF